jgi:F0F1-type ATP synthase membrane subunit b/b'
MADFKATIARIEEASKWKRGVADNWYARGEDVCGDLIEEAAEALKRAEAKEEVEAKIRIMEDQCDELAELTEQAGKQIPAEAETEVLIDLEEEMEQRKDTVEDLGRALKETMPAKLKERVEQAIQDSVVIAEKGKRYVDHVRARLEFISKDSDSVSYKGPTGEGVVPSQWRTTTEELGDEDKVAETSRAGPESLTNVLRGWGQRKANDSGWLTFDGRYASYPQFKREWIAYRETYYSVVNNDLAVKALRDKCIKGDALWMVSHLTLWTVSYTRLSEGALTVRAKYATFKVALWLDAQLFGGSPSYKIVF